MPMAPLRIRARFRNVILIFFLLMGMSFGCWASRIPDIERVLALSDAELGAVLLAAPAGELLAILITASPVLRAGTRAVIMTPLAGYAAALVGLGLAPGMLQLALLLFLFGCMGNMLNIALNARPSMWKSSGGDPS